MNREANHRQETPLRIWAFLGIIALAALLRLYRLGEESLWFDEGWSALVARMDWASLRGVLANQPFPLYYASLNAWARLGDSEFALRLLSAMAGILSVPILYKITDSCAGRRAAEFAALLFAISPLHIWYSQEARMYALATCLTLASTWAFVRAIQTDRRAWWGAYALLSLAALYAFYYALFVLLFHGFFALHLTLEDHLSRKAADTPGPDGAVVYAQQSRITARSLLWKWCGLQAITLLLFLPGMRVLFGQLGEGTWEWVARKYGRPTWSALLQTAMSFSWGDTWSGPSLLTWGALGIFALLFLAGIGKLHVAKDRFSFWFYLDRVSLFLLSYLFVPIVAVFLLSQFRPSYLLRSLVLFLPPYCAILGRGLVAVRPRALAWGLLALVLLISGVALRHLYGEEQKENWRGVAQYIEKHTEERDVICLVDEDAQAVFRYYYDGSLPVVGVSGFTRDAAELEAIAQGLASGHERVWLVISHTENESLREYLESDPRFALSGQWTEIGIRLALFRIVG